MQYSKSELWSSRKTHLRDTVLKILDYVYWCFGHWMQIVEKNEQRLARVDDKDDGEKHERIEKWRSNKWKKMSPKSVQI